MIGISQRISALSVSKKYAQSITQLFNWVLCFFLLNGLLFSLIGFPYLNAILSYGTLFKNTLYDFSGILGKSFILFFTVLNYTSHFFLLSFLSGMLLLPLLLLVPFRRVIWFVGVVLYTIAICFLLLDEYVFTTYHFHLNHTILDLILSNHVVRTLDISSIEVTLLFFSVSLVVAVEFLLVWLAFRLVKKHLRKVKSVLLMMFGLWLLSYILLLSSMSKKINLLGQQISNLPLYHQVLLTLMPGEAASRHVYNFSENYFSDPTWGGKRGHFHYPLHPMQCHKPKKNIILIMADALRFDNIAKGLMPNLAAFSKESVAFQHHLSGGNATEAGLFSLFYSLPENYWTAALSSTTPPILNTLLHDFDYETKIIWSPDMTIPPFHQTIYKGISPLRVTHQKGETSAEWDKETSRETIAFLDKKKKDGGAFFLNVFYRTTHAYCQNNHIPRPYTPVVDYCSRMLLTKSSDPEPLYNRYRNAARFVDEEIGEVLKAIKHKGFLKNSIVMITSDHGEEFNDTGQGYWGHAGNFTDYQLHVPMLIAWPSEKPRKINYTTSHFDVIPTLMKSLFLCENKISDYSVGKSLFDSNTISPFILVGSYAFMGLKQADSITVLRKSGEIVLQDNNARIQQGKKPDKKTLKKALALMRRYF
jgi:hypothetical protein